MKKLFFPVCLLLLAGCNEQPTKTSLTDSAPQNEQQMIPADTSMHNSCLLDAMAGDSTLLPIARKIYLRQSFDLFNDPTALQLMDSLAAKNKNVRPFYFKAVTLTFPLSDGFYSEALGSGGKSFVENHTAEFASYFDQPECFTDEDLLTWAKIVNLEFSISGERSDGTYDILPLQNYISQLKNNLRDSPVSQQKTIMHFSVFLHQQYEHDNRN